MNLVIWLPAGPNDFGGLSHDRSGLRSCNRRFLRGVGALCLRLREVVNMENLLVGIVAGALIVYLFWTLIAPEQFWCTQTFRRRCDRDDSFRLDPIGSGSRCDHRAHQARRVYLVHVLDPEREGGTFLDPVLGPFERFVYRLMRVWADRGQSWMQYTLSMLIFSALTAGLTMRSCGCRTSCRSTRKAWLL